MSYRVDLSLKVVPIEKAEKEKQVKTGTVKLHNTPGIQSSDFYKDSVTHSNAFLFHDLLCTCSHMVKLFDHYFLIIVKMG